VTSSDGKVRDEITQRLRGPQYSQPHKGVRYLPKRWGKKKKKEQDSQPHKGTHTDTHRHVQTHTDTPLEYPAWRVCTRESDIYVRMYLCMCVYMYV